MNIKTRKRLRHHWTDLFRLVAELEKYPEFVPNCQRTKVLSRTADGPDRTVIVSRMTVGVSAIHVGYVNRTVADLGKRQITVDALDGPLRYLHVAWTFEPDGDEWTDVGFAVRYEFGNPVMSALASRLFDAMFRQILGAFERRADQLFSSVAGTSATRPHPVVSVASTDGL
jgi:coenzyme Q-binding protein COQ10